MEKLSFLKFSMIRYLEEDQESELEQGAEDVDDAEDHPVLEIFDQVYFRKGSKILMSTRVWELVI